MQRNTAIALGVTAAGLAVALDVLIARRQREVPTSFRLEQSSELSPDGVLDRVKHVEMETETVPFVDDVEIIERGPDWVRYEVKGDALGLPWWMRYHKAWNYDDHTAKWASEAGILNIGNSGRVKIERTPTGSLIRLESHYSVTLPIGRRVVELVLRPVLSFLYGTWLYRVAVPEDKLAEKLTLVLRSWKR